MTWAAVALVTLVLAVVLGKVLRMSDELDNLTSEVAEIGTVIDSAVALLEGLAEQIRGHATEPAKLKALADELDRKAGDLARAIVASTPDLPPDAPGPGETE